MLYAMMLTGLLAAQMPFQQGQPQPAPEAEPTRERPSPTPETVDQRKIASIRARFDFARETRNQASLAVLDQELQAILPAPRSATADGGAVTPTPPANPGEAVDHQALSQQLHSVLGRYDDAALKVRARIINALLLESRGSVLPAARSPSPEPANERPRQKSRSRGPGG